MKKVNQSGSPTSLNKILGVCIWDRVVVVCMQSVLRTFQPP